MINIRNIFIAAKLNSIIGLPLVFYFGFILAIAIVLPLLRRLNDIRSSRKYNFGYFKLHEIESIRLIVIRSVVCALLMVLVLVLVLLYRSSSFK